MTSPANARSFTFLVNPASGGGAAPEAVVPVARLLRDAGATVEVTYSPGPKAMAGLLDAALGRGDVIVSVGGDGMLSSLAGPVSRADGTLAVLPAGRGNDFARMLGLPDDAAGQAAMLLEADVRRVDLIDLRLPDAAPRTVAGSVYSGVDARAAEIVDRVHWLPRKLQYPYAAVRALATYQPGRFRVTVDGDTRSFTAATVVVANSAYYGKGMKIAPDAQVDDGLLDVVVIEAAGRLDLIRSLPKVYDGRHVALPEVTVLTGRRIELAADGRAPVPAGGDGEPLGVLPGLSGAPAVLEVLPGALALAGVGAGHPRISRDVGPPGPELRARRPRDGRQGPASATCVDRAGAAQAAPGGLRSGQSRSSISYDGHSACSRACSARPRSRCSDVCDWPSQSSPHCRRSSKSDAAEAQVVVQVGEVLGDAPDVASLVPQEGTAVVAHQPQRTDRRRVERRRVVGPLLLGRPVARLGRPVPATAGADEDRRGAVVEGPHQQVRRYAGGDRVRRLVGHREGVTGGERLRERGPQQRAGDHEGVDPGGGRQLHRQAGGPVEPHRPQHRVEPRLGDRHRAVGREVDRRDDVPRLRLALHRPQPHLHEPARSIGCRVLGVLDAAGLHAARTARTEPPDEQPPTPSTAPPPTRAGPLTHRPASPRAAARRTPPT